MAKAKHITSNAECARRYGSLKNTKWIPGVVDEVLTVRNEVSGRTATSIVAMYNFGDGVLKKKTLTIKMVKERTEEVMCEENEAAELVELEDSLSAVPASVGTGSVIEIPESDIEVVNDGNPPSEIEAILQNGNDVTNASVAEALAGVEEEKVEEEKNESKKFSPRRSPRRQGRANWRSVCIRNGIEWEINDRGSQEDVGGPVPFREWTLKTPIGDVVTAGSEVSGRLSRLDFFMLMFPPSQLSACCKLTNINLKRKNRKITTKGELLWFFGLIILATRFEFSKRSSLWITIIATSKYIPAPAFGNSGMSRDRFDLLWQCIR